MESLLRMESLNLSIITQPLTPGDEQQIAEIFTMPLVRRYLQTMLWNQVMTHAQIPIPATSEERESFITQTAFIKGGVGILSTLLTITKG